MAAQLLKQEMCGYFLCSQETSANLEKSLCLSQSTPIPRFRSSKKGKGSKSSKGGKFSKGGKGNKKNGSKMPTSAVMEALEIASPVPRPVVKMEGGVKKAKGQPPAEKCTHKSPLLMVKPPSPAVKHIAEMCVRQFLSFFFFLNHVRHSALDAPRIP